MRNTTSQSQLKAKRSSRHTARGLHKCWLAVGLLGLALGSLMVDGPLAAGKPARPASGESTASNLSVDRNSAGGPVTSLQERHAPFFFDSRTDDRARDPARFAELVRSASHVKGDSRSEAERVHQRITYRYQKPVSLRFVRSLTTDRGIRLYLEAGRLIDSRHLKPVSYEARVRRAATNLWYAVKNQTFLAANGVRPSPHQVAAFREGLKQLILGSPIRTSSDALNRLYGTMNLAQRNLRLPPQTVAVEFVYGSVEALDEYSDFVPEDVATLPSAILEDHVVGIGVEIKRHDSGALVVKAIPGTPAAEAGLRKDDVIVRVNGVSLQGKSLDYIVDLITGPVGSRVRLGVQREGQGTSSVTLIRRRVPVYTVTDVSLIDDEAKIGYLKLTRFAQKTSEEVDGALWKLHRQGMRSLVIDLRGNPGGLLTTAIEISNKFLPCGTIVSTRGRVTADSSSERATYERTWKVPLVVLVDHNSASASEIFAAAIQENRRGLVVGRRSYGKGTVQTHFPLESVSGSLKLTTARFYSPTGRVMAGNGVTPDITVRLPEGDTAELGTAGPDIRRAIAVAKKANLAELAASHIGCRAGVHDATLN